MYIYRCEDSLEGIFTAIYRVYEDHRSDAEVLLALDDEPRLFSDVISVESDEGKSGKVARTLVRRFGLEDYEKVCLALAAPDMEKAQAVYQTVVQGLKREAKRGHLFDNLADSEVCRAFKLARSAEKEYCHLQGFLRFEELQSGILYARMKPKNHILSFLMEHFADRFPGENFLIHDVGRDVIGIHSKAVDMADTKWVLLNQWEIPAEKLQLSDAEEQYQELFRLFCRRIEITERRNVELQRNLLPLHFREYMTEF